MGWTVVEPLSPGVFQIDPSVYGAEPNFVYMVLECRRHYCWKKRFSPESSRSRTGKRMKAVIKGSMEAAIQSSFHTSRPQGRNVEDF